MRLELEQEHLHGIEQGTSGSKNPPRNMVRRFPKEIFFSMIGKVVPKGNESLQKSEVRGSKENNSHTGNVIRWVPRK